MAAMTLAVMTRATRGHTGRPLEVDRATVAIYFLVHVGALLRVIAPLLPVDYMGTIHLAGGLWDAAFVLFLLVYGPMALRPPARRLSLGHAHRQHAFLPRPRPPVSVRTLAVLSSPLIGKAPGGE